MLKVSWTGGWISCISWMRAPSWYRSAAVRPAGRGAAGIWALSAHLNANKLFICFLISFKERCTAFYFHASYFSQDSFTHYCHSLFTSISSRVVTSLSFIEPLFLGAMIKVCILKMVPSLLSADCLLGRSYPSLENANSVWPLSGSLGCVVEPSLCSPGLASPAADQLHW